MPAHPVGAVAAVRDPVALGELVPHAVGVAALGAHQRDEVQRAKVHLQVLFEAARLWRDGRTPGTVTVTIIQVKSEEEEEEEE